MGFSGGGEGQGFLKGSGGRGVSWRSDFTESSLRIIFLLPLHGFDSGGFKYLGIRYENKEGSRPFHRIYAAAVVTSSDGRLSVYETPEMNLISTHLFNLHKVTGQKIQKGYELSFRSF